ncbi:hypothetical protein [Tenacibaculum phage Larrie]|nr:hypothetical protein [Tenacibaculum phage Larrie]
MQNLLKKVELTKKIEHTENFYCIIKLKPKLNGAVKVRLEEVNELTYSKEVYEYKVTEFTEEKLKELETRIKNDLADRYFRFVKNMKEINSFHICKLSKELDYKMSFNKDE